MRKGNFLPHSGKLRENKDNENILLSICHMVLEILIL
jgi:hypothetical protein